MIRISQRDGADIEQVASGLEFKPVKKKATQYQFIKDINSLEPFTYTINRGKPVQIDTITSDGKETTNVAQTGDIIFSGPSKEQYVLKPAKVQKMYEGKIGQNLIPEQTPRQVALYQGEPISFMASWGEQMVIKPGDYLVKEQDGSGYYRIAQKEFEETYGS